MDISEGQEVVLKLHSIKVGTGKVACLNVTPFKVLDGHVFVEDWILDYGLDQLIIDYPNIGDCIEDSLHRPIPWPKECIELADPATLQSSIGSSDEMNAFETSQVKEECPPIAMANVTDSQKMFTKSSDVHTYPKRTEWRHRICHLEDANLNVLATGRIYACLPDEVFVMDCIGPDHVGVMVMNAIPSHTDQVMSMRLWPLEATRLDDGLLLSDVALYLCDNPSSESEEEFFSGVKKPAYRSRIRQKKNTSKIPKIQRLLNIESIRAVSSEECCTNNCCQLFPWTSTQLLREDYWRKGFDSRRECGTEVFSRIHRTRSGHGVVLEGRMICLTAWWKIHGISRATFMKYKQRYRHGKRASTHGNTGMRKPRGRTIQAQATMESIIRMNVDHMPHQMKGTGNGRQDVRKVLPSHLNWERVREEVNEVRSLPDHKPLNNYVDRPSGGLPMF